MKHVFHVMPIFCVHVYIYLLRTHTHTFAISTILTFKIIFFVCLFVYYSALNASIKSSKQNNTFEHGEEKIDKFPSNNTVFISKFHPFLLLNKVLFMADKFSIIFFNVSD